MMTLDEIDRWNVLHIEHENGTIERAVASGGSVDSGIYREMGISIDPDDPHFPDETADLRESDGDLYLLPDGDDGEQYAVK